MRKVGCMKKRILTGKDSLDEVFNKIFLNSIYAGKIYVKGNNFHMELNDVDNIIDINVNRIYTKLI